MNGNSRSFEVLEDKLDRTPIEQIAYLPERTISDAQSVAGGGMRGGRMVGSEATTDADRPDAPINLKPPCFRLAFAGAAQDALMANEVVGMIGAAVASEIVRRAIDDRSEFPEPSGFQ